MSEEVDLTRTPEEIQQEKEEWASLTQEQKIDRKVATEVPYLRKRKEITLPRNNKLISHFAEEIAYCLNEKYTLFLRPELNEIVEIQNLDGNENFVRIKPNRFITHIEKFINPVLELRNSQTQEYFYKKKSISGDLANTILQSSQFQSKMPKIKKIYTFQIPILFSDTLQFPNEGYDIRFKSWLSKKAPKIKYPEMKLEEAKEIIEFIFKEFC